MADNKPMSMEDKIARIRNGGDLSAIAAPMPIARKAQSKPSVPAPQPAAAMTSEEEGQLRDLAAKHHANNAISRNHYADPTVNPKMAREAHLELAHNQVAEPIHGAWKKHATDNTDYRSASQPQRWKMQRDFINNFHQANPEHAQKAAEIIHGAHEAGVTADAAHTQAEKRRLEESKLGGGKGSMDAATAAAHFGSVDPKAGDDAAPTVNISGGAHVAFGGQNPEAIDRALANPRFANVPEEDIETAKLAASKAPIQQHPDLEKPENKALLERHIAKFKGLMSPDYINKVKEGIAGAGGSEFDDARTATAAYHAIIKATAQHDPNRVGQKSGETVNMDTFVRGRVKQAIASDIKQQHTEQVSAAAKRATGQVQAENAVDPVKQAQNIADTKLVTAQSDPEKHAKLVEET